MIKYFIIILMLIANNCYAVDKLLENKKEGYVELLFYKNGKLELLFVENTSCLALQYHARITAILSKSENDKEETKEHYKMLLANNILNCLLDNEEIENDKQLKNVEDYFSDVHRYMGYGIEMIGSSKEKK